MAEISYLSAQMTITDLTDGTTLVTRMADNKNYGGSFFYDKNQAGSSQYVPEWPASVNEGTKALILSPTIHTTTSSDNLFKASHVTESSIKYYEHHPVHSGGKKEIPAAGVSGLFSFEAGSKFKIQIGNRWENTATDWPKLDGNQIVYSVEFLYKDPVFAAADSSFQGVPMSIQYVLTRFESGDGATYITINTNPGDVFVNADKDRTITLTALVADKGTPVVNFTANTAKWYYFDDAEPNPENQWKAVTTGVNPAKLNELTIRQDQVDGSEIFKFMWTPDLAKWYEAVKTIVDYSDPYVISMNSLNGDIFKEGQGTDKTIEVRVYKTNSVGQPTELLGPTDLAPFTATISRYKKDGTAFPSSVSGNEWPRVINGSASAAGKPMEFVVKPSDVEVYATFIASVAYTKPVQSTRRF